MNVYKRNKDKKSINDSSSKKPSLVQQKHIYQDKRKIDAAQESLQLAVDDSQAMQLKPKHYNKQSRWTESYNTKCIAKEGNNRYHGYNGQFYSDWLKNRLIRFYKAQFEIAKPYMTEGSTYRDYMESEGWSNFNCAEFIALDVAMHQGADPTNLEFTTVDKSNKPKSACSQCSGWLSGGKVKSEFVQYLQ